MNTHTVKAFDNDIGELRGSISQMGGLAEDAIDKAMQALQRNDLALAEQVRVADKQIDVIEAEVERLAVRIIALRAPMAVDLREVVAALKIAGVVERIGDYAKNIAKRVPMIESEHRIEPISILPAMGRMASEMVHDVLDAFAARDAQPLLLAARQGGAAVAQPIFDLVPQASAAQRLLDDPVEIRLGTRETVDARAISDVLVDRLRERVGLLEHHADARAELHHVHVGRINVLAVELDLAGDARAGDGVVHAV